MNHHHGPITTAAAPAATAICLAAVGHASRRAIHSVPAISGSRLTVVAFASSDTPASRPSSAARRSVGPSLTVRTSRYRTMLYIAVASASLLTIAASYDTCGWNATMVGTVIARKT